MAEVFAGFVCGFFLSAITAPVLAGTLLRLRATSPVVARMLPAGVNPAAVTIVLHLGLVFFWTGFGIVLGLMLLGLRGADSAPGFKNPAFTLLVLSFVLAITGPLAFLITAWSRQIIAGGVVTFLIFGMLMPHMAEWSKFDGDPETENNREYIKPAHAFGGSVPTALL